MMANCTKTIINFVSVFLLLPYPVSNILGKPNNFHFHHLTIRHGLSHNKVSNVFQESDWFMWISSTDGVSRYDGKNFTNYFHSERGSNSISSNNMAQRRVKFHRH